MAKKPATSVFGPGRPRPTPPDPALTNVHLPKAPTPPPALPGGATGVLPTKGNGL